MKLPEIKFIAIAPAAVLLGALMIAPASYAAFSSPTPNPASNWAAGTVVLGDDDAGSALFDGDLLAPGDGETRCVVVTSTGSLPAEVRMYGTGAAATNGLADSILLTITEGTGGSFGDCSGFTPGTVLFDGTLAQFAAAAGDYADGLGDWTTAGGTQSRTFQLGYTLDPASPDSVQGGTATISFTWEAQSI